MVEEICGLKGRSIKMESTIRELERDNTMNIGDFNNFQRGVIILAEENDPLITEI